MAVCTPLPPPIFRPGTNSFAQQLAEEGQRFTLYMATPIVTDLEHVPNIWPGEEPVGGNVESVRLPVMMEYLLEL